MYCSPLRKVVAVHMAPVILQLGAPVESAGTAANVALVCQTAVRVEALEQVLRDVVLMLSSVVEVPVLISEEGLQATNEQIS